jgi:CheY-like chemotaxis protein
MPPVKAPNASNRPRPTILIVEDDVLQRTLLKQLLRKQGYTILEARDGPEALQVCLLHRGPIQLLITDVVMPRMMSGPELAERALVLRPGLKLLYASAYADPSVARLAASDSQAAFLPKPFMPHILADKVRDLLGATSDITRSPEHSAGLLVP